MILGWYKTFHSDEPSTTFNRKNQQTGNLPSGQWNWVLKHCKVRCDKAQDVPKIEFKCMNTLGANRCMLLGDYLNENLDTSRRSSKKQTKSEVGTTSAVNRFEKSLDTILWSIIQRAEISAVCCLIVNTVCDSCFFFMYFSRS